MTNDDDDIEQASRHRQQFLTEWQASVLCHNNDITNRSDGAVAFGRVAFQASFLLNGGALIFIPAVVKLFDVPVGDSGILVSGGLFIAGLLSTWLATVAAYFTMVYQAANFSFIKNRDAVNVLDSYYPDRDKGPDDKTSEEWEAKSMRSGNVSERFRIGAIVLSFTSLFAFVLGVITGGAMLLHWKFFLLNLFA